MATPSNKNEAKTKAPKVNAAPKAAGTAEGDVKRNAGRRELVGIVTSDKMQKTVVVMVSHRVRSHQYKKYMTKRVKYKAHSEKNEFHTGDKVLLVESRPLSKDKRWRVEKLIERAREA